MVGKARNALAGQGRTGRGGDLRQGELGRPQPDQPRTTEIADQKGPTSGQQPPKLLQAGLHC